MRALIFLLIAILVILFLRWLLNQPRKVWLQFTAVGIGLGLVALAMTGRLHWLAALFGALLPFARRLLGLVNYIPLAHRLFSQFQSSHSASGPAPGSNSHVSSRYLRMSLNHDTGEMDGEVLLGRFQGRRLNELSGQELLELYQEYQAQDDDSAALLQAYLERIYDEEWFTQTGASHQQYTHSNASTSANMSHSEAYDILGLNPQASREDVIEAHRRLIQKLHPDHGGSTYLAARVNQAKDLLLG